MNCKKLIVAVNLLPLGLVGAIVALSPRAAILLAPCLLLLILLAPLLYMGSQSNRQRMPRECLSAAARQRARNISSTGETDRARPKDGTKE